MWICLNDAFLSIVKPDQTDQENLLVRARIKGDIERVFPDAQVLQLKNRDYAYRATIPAADVARALLGRVFDINYTSFKSSVAEHERHDAYMGLWRVMWNFQAKLRGKSCIEFEQQRKGPQLHGFPFEDEYEGL